MNPDFPHSTYSTAAS